MKKAKLLTLVLVVAVMLMGAGYAYWTETLTIENTVDTGVLDVIFKEPANIDGEDAYQPNADCSIKTGSANHGMVVTWTDVYPGVTNDFYFDLKNTGTMKAYVNEFAFVDTTENPVDARVDQILCHSLTVAGATVSLTAYNTDGKVTLGEALQALSAMNGSDGIALEPTGTDQIKQVFMSLEFDKDATTITLPEGQTFSFTINADVDQFNDTQVTNN